MEKIRQHALIFIILYISTFYVWLFLFKDQEFIRLLGSDLFFVIAASISFILLFQTFRFTQDQTRYFWLMLSIGVFFAVMAQIVCLYYRSFLQTDLPYPSLADAFWIMQYSIFLVALILKRWLLKHLFPMTRFLFNLFIIMTVVTTISWAFLIGPNITPATGTVISSIVSLAYPILNLGILFASLSLFFIAQFTINKTVLSLITFGFLAQILADSIYVFQYMQTAFVLGNNFFAPLWALSLLLIATAGLTSQQQDQTIKFSNHTAQQKNGNLITYGSILLLLLIVVFTHDTHSIIDVGFIVTVLLVLFRQILIISENEKLVKNLQELSSDLEKKVEQRTGELNLALEKMERMANYDALTGLPNRYMLLEHLEKVIKACKQKDVNLALLFIDLDRFKFVNDTMGHEAGDLLLIDVANLLKRCVRGDDLVARQSGDEFIILLKHISPAEVSGIAQRIIEEFEPAFLIKGKEFYTTPSIGVSMYPKDALSIEDLLRNADLAMYQAKERGKNNYQFYHSVYNTVNRKLLIENGLRNAINNNELYLVYQPQHDIITNKIVGTEALLRWKHPELGNVVPDEFIPIAENSGLILQIGKWVIETACFQNKAWQEIGHPPIKVGVNISSLQFKDPNFLSYIKEVLHRSKLAPSLLDLEITESCMQNIDETKLIIGQLKELGVSISIDDFGTGYSSLSVLNQLPIDRVKIDRSFIHDMLTHSKTASLVSAIIELGHNLEVELVAEGIEDVVQVTFLQDFNCQTGQGYLYSPPLDLKEIQSYFKENEKIIV
ncbi:MAG: EAL domain-containing protein [Bacillaceae bacterium]|nr:EAL domain-containing protein [Bacillaceae bacterium]